jgi:hypothetical protein
LEIISAAQKTMIKIRSYNARDNAQLIELTKNIGVRARVMLGVDRAPDFFSFNRMLADNWNILIAEENGQIIGFFEMHDINFRIQDRIITGIYFSLIGIQQDKRGGRLFYDFLQEVRRIAYAGNRKILLTLINEKNKRIALLCRRIFPGIIVGQKIIISGIVPFCFYRFDKNYRYGFVTETEFPETIKLISKYQKNYSFGVATDWCRLLSLPGISLKNILVAKNNNRIVSALGIWEQFSFRRFQLLSADNFTSAMLILLKLIRPLIRVSEIPHRGGVLRCGYIFAAAAEKGYEAAFSGLLRYAITKFPNLNCHLLLLGLPENDPCLSAVSGLVKFTNINIPIIFSADNTIKQILLEHTPPQIWFEYAMT